MSQESQSAPQSTPKTSGDPPNTPRSRQQSLLRMLGQLWGIIIAALPALFNLLRNLLQLGLSVVKWLGKQWVSLLPKIRAILPATLQSKLPDQAITAAAMALLVLVISVPRARSPHPQSEAQTAEPRETLDLPSQRRPDRNANRVAALQKQLTEVTAPYDENLVEAVQANFATRHLTISMTENWNALDLAQQEQIANELLKRSERLKFSQLEITDAEGEVLARSPVVGKKVVLLKTT